MMDIPIDDGDSKVVAMLRFCSGDGDRHIGEDAISHATFSHCMMSRRPDECVTILDLTLNDCIHHLDRATSCKGCDLETSFSEGSRAITTITAIGRCGFPLDSIQMLLGMYSQ